MDDSWFYFKNGWGHIISFDALDHQLFILVLTILFTLKEWRRTLILVTAFTIGHSITLALSTFNFLVIPRDLVEFLIPCTIIITAAANIFINNLKQGAIHLNYFLALFFGLVHGLGFANNLKFMLAEDQSFACSLLSFNLGLETGQIVVVAVILLLIHVLVNYVKVNRRYLIIIASFLALVISSKMAIERFPF